MLGRRIAADYPTTHKSWVLRTQPIEEFFGAPNETPMLESERRVTTGRMIAHAFAGCDAA